MVNTKVIRLVDRWIGVVACFGLTLGRKAFSPLSSALGRKPGGAPKKILLIKWIEQGATVLAYQAITEAIRQVGRENVYFSVFRENKDIMELLGLIPRENILQLRHDTPFVFIREILSSLWKIRRLGIDTTVDMEFFARGPAIFAFLTGARNRVGLHRYTSEGPYRGDLLTHRVQYNPHLHITQAYRLLVDVLKEDPATQPLGKTEVPLDPQPLPRFEPAKAEVDEVRAILARQSGSTPVAERLVILNPNASDLLPLRKWAPEKFIELARKILERQPDVTIVLTGAPNERASAEAIAREIGSPRVVSVAGHTTLRQVFVLYTLTEVMVTNDSGPGHFAVLSDMDAIVLFGPETPKLFGALSPRSHAIWAGLGCSPCVNQLNHRHSPCNDNRCMQAITVDQVYSQLAKILTVRRTASIRAA